MQAFNRMTQNPEVMTGRACIRGTRVTVGMMAGQIGACVRIDDLLEQDAYLEREDILQALLHSASYPTLSSATKKDGPAA